MEKPRQLALRLDPALAKGIEAWHARLTAERPGAKVSLADAVRTLLVMAMELPEVKRAVR